MFRKILIVTATLLIAAGAAIGTAQILFELGKRDRDLLLIKSAQALYPLSSDYYFEDYVISSDVNALRKAISLEPSKPLYHLELGNAFLSSQNRTLATDREASREICLAAELKPYSQSYKEMCLKCRALIP